MGGRLLLYKRLLMNSLEVNSGITLAKQGSSPSSAWFNFLLSTEAGVRVAISLPKLGLALPRQ